MPASWHAHRGGEHPLSDALVDELVTLGVKPLSKDASIDQIKVAQTALVGWVNGVILAKTTLGTPTPADADDEPVPLNASDVGLTAR